MDRFRALVIILLTLPALLVASPAVAQDDQEETMTFGEDEADLDAEEDDDGTMVFGEEGGDEDTATDEDTPLVGVVAVPTDTVSESQRSRIEDRVVEVMRQVQGIKLESGTAVLDVLENRDVASCVKDQLCLGGVGEEAGVDRLLMARVRPRNNAFVLDIDYFQVDERLFRKSDTATNLSNIKQVINAVEPTLADMFDLGDDGDDGGGGGRASTANALLGTGIGAGIASVGFIIGGAVFGSEANKFQKTLDNAPTNGNGVYTTLTQKQAQDLYNTGRQKASTANIFFGVGGAAAIGSGVLFYLSAKQRAAEKEEENDKKAGLFQRLKVRPSIGRRAAGVSAGFQF